ncbi:MAG: SIS domain-containing protein [Deltaproteobacteria bacterium]|nr:SIS domain-containing protein [Deltaproteobacteria bacterium]
MRFFESFYDEIGARLRDADPTLLDIICKTFVHAQQCNRKVILGGNGGSAMIASHVSVDLTKAAHVRSVCFNEPDLITCFANDYGYENWLARAIESYGDAGDVAVLISSSGRSPNIVNAARCAKDCGLTVVTLSGFDAANPLRTLGDQNLWVNSRSYNLVETVHQTWLLACVDRIVFQLNGGEKRR